MGPARRDPCTGSAPHVTRRLCATIVFFIGIVCIFGGYLLGRRARGEVRHANDAVSANLSLAAESLYRRSKRISPKSVHHNGPNRVAAKILEAFRCSRNECGAMSGNNVAELVRSCIENEVARLVRAINNASLYLDSLR